MQSEMQFENLKGRDHFVDLDIDGRISEWVLKE
jgi:hypothetical protein